jgi:hypothetical protein
MLATHLLLLLCPLLLKTHVGPRLLRTVGGCAFKAVFGIECPACGITHAVVAMMSGHIGESVRYHPAGPLITSALATTVLYFSLVVTLKQLFPRFAGLSWKREAQAYTRIETGALALLCLGWVVKLLRN